MAPCVCFQRILLDLHIGIPKHSFGLPFGKKNQILVGLKLELIASTFACFHLLQIVVRISNYQSLDETEDAISIENES